LTDYVDPRNNLAFWARPSQHVRDLVSKIQQEIVPLIGPGKCYHCSCFVLIRRQSILTAILGLWLVPSDNLHTTTLEISSERTADQISDTIAAMDPKLIQGLANYSIDHRARLVKPIISYDTSAIALSFVPAADEDDRYTYHHLRRDLYDKVTMSGISIAARYTVPSAHITIARFVKPVGATESELESPEVIEQKAKQLVAKIEDLNCELRSNVWRRLGDPSQGEWIVGHEKGLEFMWGTTWYGKGESIVLGDGFV